MILRFRLRNKNRKISLQLQDILAGAVFAVFFAYLLFTGEPVYTGDTFQHENQMIMREPGYALLIQFLRFLSPKRLLFFRLRLDFFLF